MTIDPFGATIYEFPVADRVKKATVTSSSSATEATDATPLAGEAARPVKEPSRSFLPRRNLTEEEASSPTGVRWLTADVERLDQECADLRTQLTTLHTQYDGLKDQFNDKRVELEGIKAKASISTRNELLSYLCFSAGSAGLATSPGYFSVQGAESLAITSLVVSAGVIRRWSCSAELEMNLGLKILDAGNLEKERIVLTASADDDVGHYAVFRCEETEDNQVFSGSIPNVYWFPSLKVKKGDLVVVYTKDGQDSDKKNRNGTTSTFYYWGLAAPIWVPHFRPVLVHTPTWRIGKAIEDKGTTANPAT